MYDSSLRLSPASSNARVNFSFPEDEQDMHKQRRIYRYIKCFIVFEIYGLMNYLSKVLTM